MLTIMINEIANYHFLTTHEDPNLNVLLFKHLCSSNYSFMCLPTDCYSGFCYWPSLGGSNDVLVHAKVSVST